MPRLLVVCLGALSACDTGYSATVDCQETFACCDELGDPVNQAISQAECRQTSQTIYDSLSESQRAELDDIFDLCVERGRTGCAFFVCLTGDAPTECPALELSPSDR